jgi:hypothetical protein
MMRAVAAEEIGCGDRAGRSSRFRRWQFHGAFENRDGTGWPDLDLRSAHEKLSVIIVPVTGSQCHDRSQDNGTEADPADPDGQAG